MLRCHTSSERTQKEEEVEKKTSHDTDAQVHAYGFIYTDLTVYTL